MKFKAAILENINEPLLIDEIENDLLSEGQVLVKILQTGACRSQIFEMEGQRGIDKYLPHLLGHEASGKVIKLGPKNVKVEMTNQIIGVTNEQVDLEVNNGSSSGSEEGETVGKEGKYERKTLKRQKTANIAKELTKTMSCWRTVGCGGLVMLLSMLLISILQFVIIKELLLILTSVKSSNFSAEPGSPF